MEIDPKQLKYLLALDRAGSFVRAADVLGISQPALSTAIARLEDVLEMRLVDRGRQGAVLNAAGKILTRHAHSIEAELSKALAEFQQHQAGGSGPLSVGGTPLATASIIPAVVARLLDQLPSVSIEVVENVDEVLLDQLRAKRLDVIISNISLFPPPSDTVAAPLFNARTVGVVRAGHALANTPSISLKSLKDVTWVMPSEGGAFRKQVEALFTTLGLAFPTRVVQASSFGIIKDIVRNSDGITLLSEQIVGAELREGSLIALPLQETVGHRVFGMQVIKDRKLSPLGERFCAITQEIAADFDI